MASNNNIRIATLILTRSDDITQDERLHISYNKNGTLTIRCVDECGKKVLSPMTEDEFDDWYALLVDMLDTDRDPYQSVQIEITGLPMVVYRPDDLAGKRGDILYDALRFCIRRAKKELMDEDDVWDRPRTMTEDGTVPDRDAYHAPAPVPEPSCCGGDCLNTAFLLNPEDSDSDSSDDEDYADMPPLMSIPREPTWGGEESEDSDDESEESDEEETNHVSTHTIWDGADTFYTVTKIFDDKSKIVQKFKNDVLVQHINYRTDGSLSSVTDYESPINGFTTIIHFNEDGVAVRIETLDKNYKTVSSVSLPNT